jgi:hypothetical protein
MLATTNFQDAACITIVSGLPRSGTSMMMQMLHTGGMEVMTDGLRAPDADNPRGYFELEAVKLLGSHPVEVRFASLGGKVVKILSHLLYNLPSQFEYRLILMRRDLNEILASQRVMLERNGKQAKEMDSKMFAVFSAEIERLKTWLVNHPEIPVLEVSYNQLIADGETQIEAVNQFLGGRLDTKRMLQQVDRNLYRQRAESQVAKIG